LTDVNLLERFVTSRDEAAFEVLVWRHGPLVLNVCRRLLYGEHDVEDAFQATFLALVRKAGSIGRREALAGWLYRVSYRIALAARADTARRIVHEKKCVDERVPAGAGEPVDLAIHSELRAAVDAVVNGLPKKYRLPVLLCYLEGNTYEEAARQLGWPKGTVSIRLARGRALLRKRLARLGLTVSATALATNVAQGRTVATVPRGWVATTIQNAGRLARGQVLGALFGRSVGLADGVLRAMATVQVKTGAALMLAAGILVTGAGMAVHWTPAANLPEAAEQIAEPDARPSPPTEGSARNDAHGDPLPTGALARLGTLRFRHNQNVSDIAFAPDGRTLAAVDTSEVCLWDVATGKELRRLGAATFGHGVAFAPDGKSLATATNTHIVYWDPATGRQLRQFAYQGDPVVMLAFSPDGTMLAWLTEDNTLRLSNASTGKVLRQWPGPPNTVYSSFAFSPDSRMLALACQKEKEIPLYDTFTGKEVRRFVGHQEGVCSVAFSPDGRMLVSAARDDTLRFWETAASKELHQAQDTAGGWKLAFSPVGSMVATGGGNVRLWDAATGKLVRKCERDNDGSVESLAFSPDGKTLTASRGNSHALSFWDVASGKKRWTDTGHLGPVAGIAVSPDGRLLASAAWEKNYTSRNAVHLWDAATGTELGKVGTDLGFVGGLAFSPDGRLLAAGNEDGTIRLWDPATGEQVRRLTGHKDMVESIGFTADGRTLASLGYHDRTIRLWDVATGKELRQFPSNRTPMRSGFVLAPDGKMIVQGAWGKPALNLWDATGKPVNRFGNYSGNVTALALSPDGQMLAGAENGGGVRLWDLANGKDLRRLPDPNTWIGFLVYSADGRTLASGGTDGTIRLWEVATGMERCRFVGHCGPVRCGAFSPDGRRFFSGSYDTTVLIWDVAGRAGPGHAEKVKLSPQSLVELRTDLASADASRAYRALWTLIAAPGQVVPLFRDQLRPVTAADPDRVAWLLADLDSNDFARRDRATKEIQKMREGALPALRKALASGPPPEVRRRVEQLMESLALSPEQLYSLRAVEVLEHVGSPEARQVLETLAGGVPEARLTGEAKASLERLTHRPAGTR